MEKQLETKIQQAIKLIQSAEKAANKIGQQLELCYSGGKDSDVILELAKMANVKFRAIYKNTTIDPPMTLAHVKEMGVEIMPPKKPFIKILQENGFPSRNRRFCCGFLKEYKILDNAIVGIRKSESKKREELYKEPMVCKYYSRKREHVNHWLPILEWSDKDVETFIKERNIKCHPMYYDMGGVFHVETRLGCMCCPIASRKKRIEEFLKRPKMVKMYIRYGKVWRHNHPDSSNHKYFKDVYEWFTMSLFCENLTEFKEKFGKTMFDDGIDCKTFLERYFNIKF